MNLDVIPIRALCAIGKPEQFQDVFRLSGFPVRREPLDSRIIRHPFEWLGCHSRRSRSERSGIQSKTSILDWLWIPGQAFCLPGMTRPKRTDQAEFASDERNRRDEPPIIRLAAMDAAAVAETARFIRISVDAEVFEGGDVQRLDA